MAQFSEKSSERFEKFLEDEKNETLSPIWRTSFVSKETQINAREIKREHLALLCLEKSLNIAIYYSI